MKMINSKLWIDDIRIPPDDTYDIARTYDQAITLLDANQYEDIWLDHDLSDFTLDGKERTGYTIVLWLVERKMIDALYVPLRYHYLTSNPVGRANMSQLIEHYLLS